MDHRTLLNYAEAWKRCCKAYDDEKVPTARLLEVIRELQVLFGNPNVPAPQGVIYAGPLVEKKP